MLKVFVDSDIILDLFAQRDPHYIYAAKLFTLIDRKEIIAYTSPIVFANIHYILSKLTSRSQALQNLRKLKALIKVLPIDEKIIEFSLNSDFKDFEDAIQYFTAKSKDVKFLITRNIKDYKQADMTVCTAEEFLRMLKSLESSSNN